MTSGKRRSQLSLNSLRAVPIQVGPASQCAAYYSKR